MQLQILGQGYEPLSENAVGNQLLKLLADPRFHSFTCLTAFTSQAGINGLAKHIKAAKKHLKTITIVTGVNQKGTSKEALEALLELKVNAYIFFHASSPIFHPKIYLFEGKTESELIIGSSNLTVQGLFTNIEASVLVSIDNSIETDKKTCEQLKKNYSGIFDNTDPNLKKLSKKLIKKLVKATIVPTEKERKALQEKSGQTESKEAEDIIAKIFPKRALPKIPVDFRRATKQKRKAQEKKTSEKPSIQNKPSKLLWESGALTERDLNIPKGENTNPTGSMLFKKGKSKDIDQRHYFRDMVFSSLNWVRDSKPQRSHIERAKAFFKIIINGKDAGDYELTLSHNTKKDTPSYRQNNSMTSISWGKAKSVIANDELIGKSARLYKNKGKKDEFVIVIE